MFNEGVLRDWDRLIGLDHADQCFVGEVEVQGVGVVEVVFGDIDLSFVDIFVEGV